MSQLVNNIINIPHERIDEAVGVLAAAFEHDPLIQYLLQDPQPTSFHDRLREFFRFSCAVRIELGWPLLGYEVDADLVGVACVSEPEDKQWPDSLKETYNRLKTVIGTKATRRLEKYARLTDKFRPEDPNHYLAVIGVHPEAQGSGFGRMILDAVQVLSAEHPLSIGVALDTENEVNVTFYERYGYEVTARSHLDHLDIWCMLRPNLR
jgi:ribosomal protein S18 acetylase RimI-like enzyme